MAKVEKIKLGVFGLVVMLVIGFIVYNCCVYGMNPSI
jgi:hypothetical protein